MGFRKWFSGLALSLILAFFGSSFHAAANRNVPIQERQALALFLETAIRLDVLGYTIFGEKPISITGFWAASCPHQFAFDKEAVFKNGQKIWEKYFSHMSKNYALKFVESDQWYSVSVINKKAFVKVVQEHIDEFRKVLGAATSAETLLERILKAKNDLFDVLEHDDCLLGIVLGYGCKNAQMYKRQGEILKELNILLDLPPDVHEQKRILSTVEIKSDSSERSTKLIHEYKYLNTLLKSTPTTTEYLELFPDVGFKADLNDDETKRILAAYACTKKDIKKAFLSDNFLEVVLCQLLEDSSLETKENNGFEPFCAKNRQEAEAFLSKLDSKPKIKPIIPHKLYCEILQTGPEESQEQAEYFHYKITTLDETTVVDTYNEGLPRKVCLDNAIIGFVKGVEGMKIGDKRRLYIHPELAFRKIGIYAPPDSLLIIEVRAERGP